MNKEIHELLGYKNIKIIQNEEMFKFSLDSILLAYFIETKNAKKIIDLCSGNAPIPLYLSLKTKSKIIGIEIQKDVYNLGVESINLNNLSSQIELINDDLIGIYKKVGANVFDIVSCNPPYFKIDKTSFINESIYKRIARHEVLVNLDDIVLESSRLLVDGGQIYLIHRVNRLVDCFNCLEKYNFGIKKLQFIYPKKELSAKMFIISARKNKKTDCVVMPPLYIYESDGIYTQSILEIFNLK